MWDPWSFTCVIVAAVGSQRNPGFSRYVKTGPLQIAAYASADMGRALTSLGLRMPENSGSRRRDESLATCERDRSEFLTSSKSMLIAERAFHLLCSKSRLPEAVSESHS
jgi:hypothetical protein